MDSKIGVLYVNGVIGQDTTLLDVIKQVKNQSDSTEFLVKIDSVGGYVDAGNDIYNYLKNLSIPVTTYTTKAYSIASVIFMAGSTRIIPADAQDALMIHLPWMEAVGDYSTLSDHLNELKATEDKLVKFYSEATGIDKDTIHSLLKSETYLSAEQAKDFGFATELSIQQKAVAMLTLNNNNKEIKESLMNKLERKIDSIMNLLTGKIKAEKVVQDATGLELKFPELESTDTVEVDAKVTLDGKDADGEFLLPDGSTIVTVKGKVSEIKPADVVSTEDVPAEDAPVAIEVEEISNEDLPTDATPEEKDAMIADLQEQVIELKAKLAEYEVEEVVEETVDVEEVNKMVELIEAMAIKQVEMENKYLALAKSVSSDFTSTNKKEIKTSVKGSTENMSRAMQILNSK
ncbi:Clp protease ClpP [Flavobacterium muglaense]|uniref:Clp protease ClpP n=1 Tax=Flavobacterium muglaense TaxID=2764716 RepID=A0A923MY45_9FLAO|nr:Clp protease ClpP [Flavobacterium muglaense]MBC5836795.1 Clp protease ClpP [Flavobacterium muglaense]MBC5843255.1 Clp protease ClpP [Flavobacterium muglaense]